MTTRDFERLDQLEAQSWSELGRLGRALHVKEASLETTLEAILAAAVDLIDGVEFAGLNLLLSGRFEPQAVLGAPPHSLDELQKQTGTGPCIDASRGQTVVRVDDMRTDGRWPKFAELAVSLDVLSMFCVPLWVDDVRLGSVSLYSGRSNAFSVRAARLAEFFAMHAALALADVQRTENLRAALRNRDVIGQAKGILMERHRITPEAAFDLLAVASQRANRKLSLIAEELAGTGQLPG